MEELQIYDIVNSVTSQALGRTDLTVVNDQGLIALGRTVLDSATYTDDFINTLVKRIGKTIVSFRAYKNATWLDAKNTNNVDIIMEEIREENETK